MISPAGLYGKILIYPHSWGGPVAAVGSSSLRHPTDFGLERRRRTVLTQHGHQQIEFGFAFRLVTGLGILLGRQFGQLLLGVISDRLAIGGVRHQ